MVSGVEGESVSSVAERVEDPKTAEKLADARAEIISVINRERPRFIVAFETMRFEGCKIMLTVPTEALRDEIYHAATDILMKISEVAGVNGVIEFDITVREEKRKMRPIKLEDRLAHIESKNPLYAEFKSALDLEAE
jgi:hypothetical protein